MWMVRAGSVNAVPLNKATQIITRFWVEVIVIIPFPYSILPVLFRLGCQDHLVINDYVRVLIGTVDRNLVFIRLRVRDFIDYRTGCGLSRWVVNVGALFAGRIIEVNGNRSAPHFALPIDYVTNLDHDTSILAVGFSVVVESDLGRVGYQANSDGVCRRGKRS
jgi:hypothetical protein